MTRVDHSDVANGNSPIFEFVKRLLLEAKYEPSFNLIVSINELLKEGIVDNHDLIDNPWIISKHIYKEPSLED
jgi:hypothetical protein